MRRRIVVVGGGGGRLDHLLANLLLLASPAWAGIEIEARFGARVHRRRTVARRPPRSTGEPGSLVTLLPVGGAARGIVTDGLEYPLAHEELEPGTSRGVSNVMLGDQRDGRARRRHAARRATRPRKEVVQ